MSYEDDNEIDGTEVVAPSNEQGWAKQGNRYWTPTPTAEVLPAGVYSVGASTRIGIYLDRVTVVKDDLVPLPGMGANEVLHEIEQFFARAERYRERGVVHKRGILMVGPPGTGKTSTSELLIEMFTEKVGGIVLLGTTANIVQAGIKQIRSREPKRPIMVVIEDIDSVIRREEEEWLNLLDGKMQFDGVVFVATTNYLDKLPDRIANRPSRFDLVVTIATPPAEARAAYLAAKEPAMPADRVQEIIALSDGYSIAHLKELLILTEVYEMDLTSASERINAIIARKLVPQQASLRAVPIRAAAE